VGLPAKARRATKNTLDEILILKCGEIGLDGAPVDSLSSVRRVGW
jgi:hypothetical protein